MKKIPTIFERDWAGDRSRVLDKPVAECAWVFAGEGNPTRKWDGTAVLMRGGRMFKRYELRPPNKTPPDGFEYADIPDPETGRQPGWVPVGDGPEDKWHREALDSGFADGTYELVGPKVQGNPERFDRHLLLRHGADRVLDTVRGFNILRALLEREPIEGLVWHHPDGRMAKIKRRDFGLPWPPDKP